MQSTYLNGVDLDDDTLVRVGVMTIVVLFSIIGMNGVEHIDTDHVTVGQSLQVGSGGVASLSLAAVGGQTETLKGSGIVKIDDADALC